MSLARTALGSLARGGALTEEEVDDYLARAVRTAIFATLDARSAATRAEFGIFGALTDAADILSAVAATLEAARAAKAARAERGRA